MKEYILEQLVDECLQHKGYFTRHNVKFRPDKSRQSFRAKEDSTYSEIDVIGVHPRLRGVNRVCAVSCKSWHIGFNPKYWIKQIRGGLWKPFREIAKKRWAEAFVDKVEEVSGSRKFTYITVVTSLKGDKQVWEEYAPFQTMLEGNPLKITTFEELLDELWPSIGTTPASSEFERVLQLIKASRWRDVAKQED